VMFCTVKAMDKCKETAVILIMFVILFQEMYIGSVFDNLKGVTEHKQRERSVRIMQHAEEAVQRSLRSIINMKTLPEFLLHFYNTLTGRNTFLK
jgi:hypothetical protein